jgi:Protein of unknown function, DUF547
MIQKNKSNTLRRGFAALLLGLPLAGFGGIERWLAPSMRLWPVWQAHDEAASARIDHAPWTAFLARYLVVGEINLIRYSDVSPADRQALKAYIRKLAAVPIRTARRAEQLAYWVNLYNSLTVDLVLDHYPVASIRDISISPGLLSFGPWDKALITIDGKPVTLNDIEHRILRPIWQDARLHYVLNCASLGCPSLPPVALTAESANDLMEAGAIAFVNGHGIRLENRKLAVSSLYAWFTEDFGGDEAGVVAHLRRYARPPLLTVLAGRTKIDDDFYDWRLNDARRS